jgi:uncharacterized damage-inducible protein DinB
MTPEELLMKDISRDPAEVLSKFQAAPSELEALLCDLPSSYLERELYPGGWTIAEVAHHIADGDALWKACILAGLADAVPVFTLAWYWSLPQDKWAQRWHYASRAITDSLAMFRANRRITATSLARTPHWWGRQVTIEWSDGELETQTILDLVESQADHAMQHIEEIRQALAPSPGDQVHAAGQLADGDPAGGASAAA